MDMPKIDSLLATAKIATTVIRIGLVVGIIVLAIKLAIGLFALVAVLLGFGAATTPAPSLALSAGIVADRLLTLIALSLAAQFFARLAQIIGTVGRADPFTSENADRLYRMGWLALSAQLLAIPIALLSGWLEPEFVPGIRAIFGISLSALTLPLTLFILARVFRKGTEMREDLEGTV